MSDFKDQAWQKFWQASLRSPIQRNDSLDLRGKNKNVQAVILGLYGMHRSVTLSLQFKTWCQDGEKNEQGLAAYLRISGTGSTIATGVMNATEKIRPGCTTMRDRVPVYNYDMDEQGYDMFCAFLEDA